MMSTIKFENGLLRATSWPSHLPNIPVVSIHPQVQTMDTTVIPLEGPSQDSSPPANPSRTVCDLI